MMKILLLGKDGQVGWELQRSLAPLGEVIALNRQGDGGLCGDLMNPEGLIKTVQCVKPDAIVNASAYTAVDRAETEREIAQTVNAEAVDALAKAAESQGAWLVHYSTDYVFSGAGETPWVEDDQTAPMSVYGQTKRDGERALTHASKHLLFRTSWVYAARGQNFLKTILRLAAERDTLRVIDDQVGAPTGAALIADVTALVLYHVLQRPCAANSLTGTYHLAAQGFTSWYAYARFLVESAHARGAALRLYPEAVSPIPATEYPLPAPRPLNSRLETSKLSKTFGLRLPPWQQGVEQVLDLLISR